MNSLTRTRKIIAVALGALAIAAVANSASAETQWERNHPRRDQVNDRLENQNARINREYREGEISKARERKLHAEDHRIRGEERLMASMNGGHITRLEQASLNQQENKVSHQIGR